MISRGRFVRFAAAATAAGFALPAAAQAAGTYIVQLKDDPLASYTGGTNGIPGTSPKVTGRKLKPDSAPGLDYRSYLASRQKAVLDRVPGAAALDSYRFAFAGFAAKLSAAQAERVRKDARVARVFDDTLLHPTAAAGDPDARLGGFNGDGASYLRLTDPVAGLWQRLGGPVSRNGAGAGVIVGVIDTGIQPGHPSFADRGKGYIGQSYQAPAVWDGACQSGDGFSVSDCNNKLIGARYYVDGFGRDNLDPKSHLSPRDDEGHGTHTASTAAGNYGVDPVIDGNDLGVDVISGIAPRAYVAMYKVCWEGNEVTSPAGCSTADSVKAIDDAVADGVDVINYSVGSDTSTILTADSYAFLGASDAGVFVANSAGNAGPGAGTVGSPASVPWLTTVGASTLARAFISDVTIRGAGETFTLHGASVTNALPATPVVDAAAAGLPGKDASLCRAGELDPAKVAGKVVLCLRGDNARIDKSLQVRDAGGVGMILYNASDAQDLDTDTHWVPSAHVSFTDGSRVKAALARGPVTAALTQGRAAAAQPRVMAAFSSRGPQTAMPDLAKPDVTAPGVQILAGAADQPAPTTLLRPGLLFQAIQGTSMASPHVAGAAALLTQAHPTLSPAELKSELMLTANPDMVKEDGSTPAGVFDRGSGEIDPNRAVDSGLVLDTTTADYVSYIEWVDPTFFDGDLPQTRPSDLNLPSISFSQFAGREQTTRVFRSVDSTATRWTVSFEGLPGVSAAASTGQFFTIKPGQTQPITVTLRETTAPVNAYVSGALVLTSGARTLRVPISVRPIPVAAPATVSVNAAAASGSQPITVTTGATGPLSGVGWGLAAADVHAAQRISATTGDPDPSGADPGTQLFPLTVPAGAQLVSAKLSNVDGGSPNTDLDLYLYRDDDGDGDFSNATLVAVSGSSGSDEDLAVALPRAGAYAVAVVGFTTAPGGSVYDLSTWVVNDPSPDDASNPPAITVTGDGPATAGVPVTLTLNWSGVDAPGLYRGLATYHASATPTTANIAAYSLVQVSRGGDAPAPAAPGAAPLSEPVAALGEVAPPPAADGAAPSSSGVAPSSGGVAPASTRVVTLRSATLRGRVLTLRLRGAQAGTVRVSVKRGARFVARSASRRVSTATRTVRLKLDRRLARGTYTVKVIAGKRTVGALKLKAR
ncbi:MAG TPA: S8 family serine peptidase [Solirubrobacter sp.]|nr:S8 family serine peptidase [Solirubrobacter sp.]